MGSFENNLLGTPEAFKWQCILIVIVSIWFVIIPFFCAGARCEIDITGSAVAMHCCNGHSKINIKIEISTPCRVATPQNFILKSGTRDSVRDIPLHAHFAADRFILPK